MKIKQLSLIFSLISVFSSSLVLSSAFEKECMPEFSLEALQAHRDQRAKEIETTIEQSDAYKKAVITQAKLEHVNKEWSEASKKCNSYNNSPTWATSCTEQDCIDARRLHKEWNQARRDAIYASDKLEEARTQEIRDLENCIKDRRYNAIQVPKD